MNSFFDEPNKNNDGYEVGYGKPPVQYRFKKGHSGNIYGRPKDPETLQDCFNRELSKKIKVKEGDKMKKITKLSALSKFVVNALFDPNKEDLLKFALKTFLKDVNLEYELKSNYEPIYEESPQRSEANKIITMALKLFMDEQRGIKPPY